MKNRFRLMNKWQTSRYVFLLFVFLYIDNIFAQDFESEQAKARAAIVSSLATADIAIVGWAHYAENTAIPQIVKNCLTPVKARYPNIVLITESPEGTPIDRLPDESHGQAYIEMLAQADVLKIPISGADHPKLKGAKEVYFKYFETKPEDEPIKDLLEIMGVTDKERNWNMAKVASELARNGNKVILVVGDDHVEPVTTMLKAKGLKAAGFRSTLDWTNRHILFEGKVVGLLEDTSFVRGMCESALRRLRSFEQRKSKPLNP